MSILNHRFGTLAHALTGFALALKGYTKMTDHHAVIGGIILFSGLVIIGYVLYERKQKTHSRMLGVGIHFLEGLALLFTSWVYFEEGKTYLPYVTLIAAIGFFITVPFIYRKNKRLNNPHTTNLPEQKRVMTSPDEQ